MFVDAPSVPSPTGMPRVRTASYGKTRPTASFMFDTGLVTTTAPLGDDVEILLPHPHRVREHRARREEPEPVEVRARRLSRAFEQPCDLVLDLEEVDVDRERRVRGLLRDPAQ